MWTGWMYRAPRPTSTAHGDTHLERLCGPEASSPPAGGSDAVWPWHPGSAHAGPSHCCSHVPWSGRGKRLWCRERRRTLLPTNAVGAAHFPELGTNCSGGQSLVHTHSRAALLDAREGAHTVRSGMSLSRNSRGPCVVEAPSGPWVLAPSPVFV